MKSELGWRVSEMEGDRSCYGEGFCTKAPCKVGGRSEKGPMSWQVGDKELHPWLLQVSLHHPC